MKSQKKINFSNYDSYYHKIRQLVGISQKKCNSLHDDWINYYYNIFHNKDKLRKKEDNYKRFNNNASTVDYNVEQLVRNLESANARLAEIDKKLYYCKKSLLCMEEDNTISERIKGIEIIRNCIKEFKEKNESSMKFLSDCQKIAKKG